MKVLVTGGSGFIGCNLCKRLVKEGHQVVAIDNLSNGSLVNMKGLEESPQFTFYEFDVNNTIKLRAVFDKHPFDMVFHLVANADVNKGEESAVIDIEKTLQTTLSVLEMMRIYEIKKFLFSHPLPQYMAMRRNAFRNIDPLCVPFLTMEWPNWLVKHLLALIAVCTISKYGLLVSAMPLAPIWLMA